jgi:hypothetical protein
MHGGSRRQTVVDEDQGATPQVRQLTIAPIQALAARQVPLFRGRHLLEVLHLGPAGVAGSRRLVVGLHLARGGVADGPSAGAPAGGLLVVGRAKARPVRFARVVVRSPAVLHGGSVRVLHRPVVLFPRNAEEDVDLAPELLSPRGRCGERAEVVAALLELGQLGTRGDTIHLRPYDPIGPADVGRRVHHAVDVTDVVPECWRHESLPSQIVRKWCYEQGQAFERYWMTYTKV